MNYLRETEYAGWIMVEDESPRAEKDSDGVVKEDGNYMAQFWDESARGGV